MKMRCKGIGLNLDRAKYVYSKMACSSFTAMLDASLATAQMTRHLYLMTRTKKDLARGRDDL